jgi:predicted  nucleic acid-binding Zn-ribbon protein
MTNVMTQLRELDETFEVVQTEYENICETDVEKLKATKQDLESDRGRIAHKIHTIKRKMNIVKNPSEQLSLTGKLPSESEQEMKLTEQINRLNDEKRLVIHRQQVSSDRIKNIRAHLEQQLQMRRA